jgi:molybdate transport system ATP-binding protein
MKDPRLEARVVRRFPSGARVDAALSLPLEGAPVTVLFGPSGSGKTTLLRCLAGLERPDGGRIAFRGTTWFDEATGIDLPPRARRVGFLHQDLALFPHLTVAANVAFGLSDLPREARRRRCEAALERFDLRPLAERRPDTLSGGQRQRVALARTVVTEPALLLLDEPLSALDAPTREDLRVHLRRHLEALAIPALVVTHDRIEAMVLGDRMAVMIDGEVRQVGPVDEVVARPADPDVARAVGVETALRGRVHPVSDGLAEIDCGAFALHALAGDLSPGAGVLACVRGEDVVIRPEDAARGSARNRLVVRIVSIRPEGPLARLALDAGGVPLVGLVTRASARELDLSEGARVLAEIKVPAIHVVPEGGSAP